MSDRSNGVFRRAITLAAKFKCHNGFAPNVLYLGVEEHLELARESGPAMVCMCHKTGHFMMGGFRLIRVTEKNWLDVGRYDAA